MGARIRDKRNVKIFVLYLMQNINYPLDYVTLNDIVMQNDYVMYLDFAESFHEMLDSDLVVEECKNEAGDPMYIVSDKGRIVATELHSEILSSLLDKSLECASVGKEIVDQENSVALGYVFLGNYNVIGVPVSVRHYLRRIEIVTYITALGFLSKNNRHLEVLCRYTCNADTRCLYCHYLGHALFTEEPVPLLAEFVHKTNVDLVV